MNLFKNFRKPYLSTFLASLFLFVSCNQHDEIPESDNYLSLDDYVKNHLITAKKVLDLTKNENSINLETLQKIDTDIKFNQIESILIEANFQNHNIIAQLLFEMKNNSSRLIDSNPYLLDYDEKEFKEILNLKIKEELNKLNIENYRTSNDCDDEYKEALEICNQNYYFSLAIVTIGTLATTFGVGTAIGVVGAVAALVVCGERAFGNYEECEGVHNDEN